MMLQSGYFDNFKGGPTLLIWGDAAGLRMLAEVLRTPPAERLALDRWCKAVDGKPVFILKDRRSSMVPFGDAHFVWRIRPEDATDYADKIEATISTGRPGHQYLEAAIVTSRLWFRSESIRKIYDRKERES